jgi:hypothetical protein
VNMPSGIVTKPPKPGFVGFGSTYLGHFQVFLVEFFLCFAGRGGLIEGLFVPDGAIVVAIGPKRGGGPTKSLNESSQGGGDVWYPLESGHQEGGNGVLEMSVYTT